MERFFEAYLVLLSAGKLAEATVRRPSQHDDSLYGTEELIALRNGLSVMAERECAAGVDSLSVGKPLVALTDSHRNL